MRLLLRRVSEELTALPGPLRVSVQRAAWAYREPVCYRGSAPRNINVLCQIACFGFVSPGKECRSTVLETGSDDGGEWPE